MQGATAAVEQTLQTSLRPGLSMLSSMVSTEGIPELNRVSWFH